MGRGSWSDVDKPRKSGSFLQLEDGETRRIRVLDEAPWTVYVHRIRQPGADGQSEIFLSVQETAKPDEDYIAQRTNRYPAQPQHNVRVLVFNDDGEPEGVKVLSGGVQIFRPMKGFVERYGDIRDFDLEITRSGSKRETEYSVTIAPNSYEIDVAEWYEQAEGEIDMDALFAAPTPDEQAQMVERAGVDLDYDPAAALMEEMSLDEALGMRFPFGKKYGPDAYPPHGKKIGEILAIDAGFIQWAAENVTSDDRVAAACRLAIANLDQIAKRPERASLPSAASKPRPAANTAAKPATAKGTQAEAAPGAPDDGTEPLPAWGLKMTPAEYLEKFPKGPKAALAKQLVEAAKTRVPASVKQAAAKAPAAATQPALVAEVMAAFNENAAKYPEPSDIVNLIKEHGAGKTRVKDLTAAQLGTLLEAIRS